MKPATLRTRLTFSYAIVLSLFLAALAFGDYRVVARQLDVDATSELAELTRGVRGYLHVDGNRPALVYDHDDPEEAAFVQDAAQYLQIYDARSGQLLEQSGALGPLGVTYAPGEIGAFVAHPGIFDVHTDRRTIRFSNTVMAGGDGAPAWLVQVGVPLDARDEALGRLLSLFAWSLPAGLVVVLVIGKWMAGRALSPIAHLAAAARGIGVEALHRRVPVRGSGDEVDQLADAFNGVLSRLEHAVGDMRQFSAAMAHEIRTPLAALRAELETSLHDGPWHEGCRGACPERSRGVVSQLEEIDKLARLLGQLLTLARAEGGELAVARERVALAPLAQSVVDALEPVAQARDISLTCDYGAALSITGDRGWMEQLLVNLIDNAIKFTPPGGWVRVRVAANGDRARLSVSDSGAGIPAETLPRIFDRFYRGRSGALAGPGRGRARVEPGQVDCRPACGDDRRRKPNRAGHNFYSNLQS